MIWFCTLPHQMGDWCPCSDLFSPVCSGMFGPVFADCMAQSHGLMICSVLSVRICSDLVGPAYAANRPLTYGAQTYFKIRIPATEDRFVSIRRTPTSYFIQLEPNGALHVWGTYARHDPRGDLILIMVVLVRAQALFVAS